MKLRHLNVRSNKKAKSTNWLTFITDESVKLAIPVGPRFQANIPLIGDCESDNSKWFHSMGKAKSTDRVTFITDESVKLVIPVGPRFQADIPLIDDCVSDNSKWVGTQIWPIKRTEEDDNNNSIVGKGRSDEICECAFPRSTTCVRKHISDKKFQLQKELGPAFWKWKFHEMGENVSKLWSLEEQKKFEYVVKMNAISINRCFMKSALECLPGHTRKSIVSYYLNVHIPRQIRVQIGLRCTNIGTDDDDGDNDVVEDLRRSKRSRRRFQANNMDSRSPKYIKTMYLVAQR